MYRRIAIFAIITLISTSVARPNTGPPQTDQVTVKTIDINLQHSATGAIGTDSVAPIAEPNSAQVVDLGHMANIDVSPPTVCTLNDFMLQQKTACALGKFQGYAVKTAVYDQGVIACAKQTSHPLLEHMSSSVETLRLNALGARNESTRGSDKISMREGGSARALRVMSTLSA